MPRERTTWNRDEIAKRASHSKSADPYLMNQDHVKVQPSADKYVTGDPSSFAEDPHDSASTWRAEYSGDQVKRNEIGMPEFRKDTFNHPEKTAGEAAAIAKAALAVAVSRAILPRTASEAMVEDQAESFMHLPEVELAATYKRLAAEQDDQGEGQDQGQDQGQDKEAGELPPALKEHMEKKKEKAEGQDQGQDKEANQDQGQQQDQGQDKQAQQTQLAQQMQQLAQMQQQVAQMLQQAQQVLQGQHQVVQPQVVQAQDQQQAEDQGQQDQGDKQAQDQGQQQDQGQDKQAAADRIHKAMMDAIAAGQDPVKAAFEATQACMGPPVAQADDSQLIDQMLAQQEPVVSDMGLELDTPPMDVGEMALTAKDDEVLRQLFANQETEDAQQAQGDQGQQKQAHAVRTASTRTVGTRPTGGVSQLGGLPSTGGRRDDVANLASMWNTAPDVSSAFGINGR